MGHVLYIPVLQHNDTHCAVVCSDFCEDCWFGPRYDCYVIAISHITR